MSLRMRLIISYTLIVVLCLAVVAVAVSVMLQGYRDKFVMSGLDDMSRSVYFQLRALAQEQVTLD